MNDRRTLKREYKDIRRPMGVYRVVNRENGRCLVGWSLNIPGTFNRIQFQLKMGDFRNKELQEEWKTYGSDAFDFETLELLEPDDDPIYDHREDLRVLEELWLEKLGAFEAYG